MREKPAAVKRSLASASASGTGAPDRICSAASFKRAAEARPPSAARPPTDRHCATTERGHPDRGPSSTPRISTPSWRSCAIRRITASCWKSFSPNKRDVGPHRAKQLGDDGRDPVEMARPRLAFPAIAQALHAHRRREARRIHILLPAGSQSRSQPASVQHRGVLLLLPRVAVEVLVRPELQRIDEDGGGDPVRAAPRFLDQARCARRGAHPWSEPAPGFSPRPSRRSERR